MNLLPASVQYTSVSYFVAYVYAGNGNEEELQFYKVIFWQMPKRKQCILQYFNIDSFKLHKAILSYPYVAIA